MSDTDTPKGFAPFDLFPYNPQLAPAFAFLGLFGAVAILHLMAMIPYRSFFTLPLVIGCAMESVSYYFRSRSHDDVRRTLPFIIQNLLVLSAPPFLAASIYMSPRRIARVLEGEHLSVAYRWTTKIFILIDIGCFVTQVAGSIMSGSEVADEASNGRTIILAGLILQIVAFGLFITLTVIFHVRMHSASKSLASTRRLSWQRYLYALYFVSGLFVMRNVTRIVEYQQGHDGEMLSNEAWLYALDAFVMFLIAAVVLVLHPGRLRMNARRFARLGSGEDQIPLK